MRKMLNTTHVEGVLYDHDLVKKVTGETSKNPGTEFISGTISVATDDAQTNIVTIHYTYVTENTSKGKSNPAWKVLESIIDNNKTIMNVGADEALRVRCDSAIGYNEFYSDRNGDEELVRVRRNEGGFVHAVTDALDEDEKNRDKWKADMLITNVREVEADEERNLPAKAVVCGYIFNFNGNLIPTEFTAKSPAAMNYFLGLDASVKNPTLTCVWGRQISQTVTKTTTTESAFGEAEVHTTKSSVRDFVITGAAKMPHEWDDESTMTAQEFKEALANRETELATIKQRQDEYAASKQNSAVNRAAATPKDKYIF